VRLADAWATWIADNLLRGADPDVVLAELVASGVPLGVARRAMAEIACTPAYDAGRVHAARAERYAQVLRLLRDGTRGASRSIREVETIDEEAFYAEHFDTGRPLVLTGMTREWPALERWGVDDLRERFGEATVQICSGRDGDPQPDRNFEQHLEEVTVEELARRLEEAEGRETNDFYLIANNQVLRDSALGELLEDVKPPAFMHEAVCGSASSLWIGPRGTVTPLHHDNCHILFCQIVGRKRFRLVPPFEMRLLDAASGFYADPELAEDPDLEIAEVTLEPGMALFLPMGWWHDVRSLDTSISVSLLRFKRSSAADWYAPGSVRR
jgi:hypothetical protein